MRTCEAAFTRAAFVTFVLFHRLIFSFLFFYPEAVDKSKEAYGDALTKCSSSMKPTDPIRLGLALNFSVFYYEILNDQDKACELAKSVSNHSYIAENLYLKDTI